MGAGEDEIERGGLPLDGEESGEEDRGDLDGAAGRLEGAACSESSEPRLASEEFIAASQMQRAGHPARLQA